MIIIYTRPDCIFCSRAKTLLKSRNIPFKELIQGKDFLDKPIFIKTLPLIYDGLRIIGGYDELVTEVAKNKYLGMTLLNEGGEEK